MSESEYRCHKCSKKLFTSDAPSGRSTVVCPRCGTANTIYHGGYQKSDALPKLTRTRTL